MTSIPQSIVERSRSLHEGEILSPREFLHLGSRAAVDQAFCRLVKAGHLTRISRGLYVSALQSPTICPRVAAESWASRGRQLVTGCGLQAAFSFGLAAREEMQEEWLTSGRSRTLSLGGREVRLQHAPHWMLSLGSSPAGEAVRAMAWLGKERAAESATVLYQRLPAEQRSALEAIRVSLPCWMASAIGRASLQSQLPRQPAT